MARQASILKLKGTIGGISFYKSKDGYLAREKGGVSASRIANDPAFARTRENGQEFGNAGSAAKLLRVAMRTLLQDMNDPTLTARMTSLMMQIKNLDSVNTRGERSVVEGLLSDEGQMLLMSFNFNSRSPLGSVLFADYVVDMTNREFRFPALVASRDFKVPAGATDFRLKGAIAVVDFANSCYDVSVGETACFPIDSTTQEVTLTIPEDPKGSGVKLFLVLIEFLQTVNGKEYNLRNGIYNSLSIMDIRNVE